MSAASFEQAKQEGAATAVERALAEVERARRKIEQLRPQAELCERLAARYPNLCEEVRIMHGYETKVWIDVRTQSLAEVQPMLSDLVRSGPRPFGRTDYTDEMAPRVVYRYGEDSETIIVNVMFLEDSSRCTLRKVGEKTVPVMEIVCE